MRFRVAFVLGLGLWCVAARWPAQVTTPLSAPLSAQGGGMFLGSTEDLAIKYATAPLDNPVVAVNQKLADGTIRLTLDGRGGYLQSALQAFDIPIESQLLVFSPTSLQARLINPGNPRALFFNDRVVVGYVRGGEILEVAAQDATAGIVFYTLEQKAGAAPEFRRVTTCLGCHLNADTLGVPGLLMFSTTPASATRPARSTMMDHRMPLKDRWGGWFVTGSGGRTAHIGNQVPALDGRGNREIASAAGLFEPDGFRATTSDIAALMVFSHQTYMTNLITRAGWEARAADPRLHPPFAAAPGEDDRIAEVMRGIANEVVDYLLFIDETPLTDRIRGGSGFAERFSAAGPWDRQGRSLHQLDLGRRLMMYPCSYVIYSPAFDQLPAGARDAIYKRLWEVLSGAERQARYRSALSLADRQAIAGILRDTKPGLPSYFRDVTR
ncbi:MAG: hypothetical protein ABI868_08945 [Acidobacteriota bacterium]